MWYLAAYGRGRGTVTQMRSAAIVSVSDWGGWFSVTRRVRFNVLELEKTGGGGRNGLGGAPRRLEAPVPNEIAVVPADHCHVYLSVC